MAAYKQPKYLIKDHGFLEPLTSSSSSSSNHHEPAIDMSGSILPLTFKFYAQPRHHHRARLRKQ
jgi:hypothetical protein